MTLSKKERRERDGERWVSVCVLDVKLHEGSRRMVLWLVMMCERWAPVWPWRGGGRVSVDGCCETAGCQTDGGMPNRTQAYSAPDDDDDDAGEASSSARVQGLVFGSVRCGFVVVVRVGGV